MRKNNQSGVKARNDHPIFLADDEPSQSRTVCQTCCRYEEDISILQEKLMETHNKLIQQIDICREQQIKIMKLSSGNRDRDRDREGENNNHAMNRQHSGKIIKKNDDDYIHSMQPLIEAKTELLRNDLQAMRAKVLSQISKSNKLKQQNRDLEAKYERDIQEYREKIRKVDGARHKLLDDNQKLQEELERVKKSQIKIANKCICGYEQKYFQLDKAFMNQRTVTSQLLEQNNRLQAKMHDLYEEKQKAKSQHNDYSGREEIHTEPKRRKTHHVREGREKNKEQFQATKKLIKKLQEAELQIRSKNGTRS